MGRPAEELLGFDTLTGMLCGQATWAPGRRALEALRFTSERERLEASFAVIGEATEYLGSGSEMGFGALADPEPWLGQLARPGAVLEPKQLLEAAALAETGYEARRTLGATRDRWPRLAARGAALADLRPLAAAVRHAILPSGELSDGASGELKRIRERRVRVRERTHETLRVVLRRLSEAGSEEDYITVRNDRYVIPVRAAGRRAAPGVVHGASSTGQTLFVEPLEAVEGNNELVQLAEAEAAEIARVLEELTGRWRENLPAAAGTAAALGELDSIFARGRYARRYGCVLPRLVEGGRLRLKGARHPVLEEALAARGRRMVPVGLELGGGETVMVISGPNAGGKTVVLKTVGLAALSAQAGIPVAAEEAELPVADCVLADIGDEQSITADLSTFSAHVLNLRAMLERASNRSLVLIDEIGTGTAPEEGSALAIAILEEFRRRGSLTLATTHHDRVKSYALAAGGVTNAAVEFDAATLQPTYRLLTGLPGTSSGIEIARRLGLPAEVIARAQQEIEPKAREAGALIETLHRLQEELDERLGETAAERARVEEERARLRGEWAERQGKRIEELERDFGEALGRAEKEIARLSADVADRKLRAALEKQGARGLGRIRAEGRAAADAAVLRQREETQREAGVAGESERAAVNPERLAAGMKVRVRGLSRAVVVRGREEGSIEVQAGPLRMKVPLEDVWGMEEEAKGAAGSGVTVRKAPSEDSGEEINVIGCRMEEAVRRVERYLDRAALEGKASIRVVHGHGTGALRRGLREFLSEHPLVARVRAEEPERGGEAVTVAELKD